MARKEIVHIDGLREVELALKELPKATAKNILRRIARERLETVAEYARAHVPVDDADTKNSITVSTKLTRRQRGLFKSEGRDDVNVFMGPGNMPQAHMTEFGTRKDRAQPFMRPAWDNNKASLYENIREDIWREIEKAVARRNRKLARGK